MRTALEPRPGRRLGAVAAQLAVMAVAAGCTAGPGSVSAPPATSAPGAARSANTSVPTTTPAGAAQPVTVEDEGATYRVAVTPVSPSIFVTVGTGVWSASPDHQFLREQLSVTNPTSTAESLADFDDPVSGLAGELEMVVPRDVAQRQGYGLDCGAQPILPSGVCPISFGEGLTVDSDSSGSGSELPPGHTAEIVVSYGPVPDVVDPAAVSVWFVPASPGPSDLSG